MIDPVIVALTTDWAPVRTNSAGMSSATFPSVTLSSPPMDGRVRAATSSVPRRIQSANTAIPTPRHCKDQHGRAAEPRERPRRRDGGQRGDS